MFHINWRYTGVPHVLSGASTPKQEPRPEPPGGQDTSAQIPLQHVYSCALPLVTKSHSISFVVGWVVPIPTQKDFMEHPHFHSDFTFLNDFWGMNNRFRDPCFCKPTLLDGSETTNFYPCLLNLGYWGWFNPRCAKLLKRSFLPSQVTSAWSRPSSLKKTFLTWDGGLIVRNGKQSRPTGIGPKNT